MLDYLLGCVRTPFVESVAPMCDYISHWGVCVYMCVRVSVGGR